jgi:hypothetical protein
MKNRVLVIILGFVFPIAVIAVANLGNCGSIVSASMLVVSLFVALLGPGVIMALFQPKQTVHVKVLKILWQRNSEDYTAHEVNVKFFHQTKNNRREMIDYTCFITFGFPDGLEKEFEITAGPWTDNGAIQENATGTLTYKERKNGKNFSDRWFIDFVKD